ncbi:Membrane-associated progesterone-binding protein 4 [Nymphaea thermarum]|nr:Membrane-associated progesterone-binding protein 4 [Nymphaea thermarum]
MGSEWLGPNNEVWCDDGHPRLVQRPGDIALTGKISQRCACFKEDELDQTGLEVYAGCDPSPKTPSLTVRPPASKHLTSLTGTDHYTTSKEN